MAGGELVGGRKGRIVVEMKSPVGDRPRILLLHGLSSRGESKAAFLRRLGCEVLVPPLPGWSFRSAVRVAHDALDDYDPDLIVGSSRGGAVALAIRTERPLVLLAPAWRYYFVRPRQDAQGVVIHSARDRLVPIGHSRELCRRCPGLGLVVEGEDHRLNCPASRRALAEAIDGLFSSTPSILRRGNVPDPSTTSPSDRDGSTPGRDPPRW